MDKEKGIILRYLIAFLPFIFYNQIFWFLKYITFHLLNFVFGIFNTVTSNFDQGTMIIGTQKIALIEPCIAVSAFILLFLLNITTLDVKPKDRLFSFLLSFGILFAFNILRIIFLYSIIGFDFFDAIHLIVWYGLSTIVVVLDWIWMTKRFKIGTIPVVSDFAYLLYALKHDIKKEQARKKKFREEMNY
ncbi:pacearchaeosortase [Candidatus Pacearchaeota archaeon]|nr:pacearchaeosortase [Candidatus Pacearchaeota archaeon]